MEVIKSYYTHEEIVLPIITKHQAQFPPPSPTPSDSSLKSSPTVSRTSSVKVQPASLSSPSPTPRSAIKVPEPMLTPYGSSYGTRATIKPQDVAKKGRIPPTPTSPVFGSGDMFGALLSLSYKDKNENRGGKKEKVMPKVMMTPS